MPNLQKSIAKVHYIPNNLYPNKSVDIYASFIKPYLIYIKGIMQVLC